jgi:hypothetical protein
LVQEGPQDHTHDGRTKRRQRTAAQPRKEVEKRRTRAEVRSGRHRVGDARNPLPGVRLAPGRRAGAHQRVPR